MKKVSIPASAFLILALSIFLGCLVFPGTVAAKKITLTFSDIYPATHPNGKLAIAWAREVEKRTNGQIRIIHYPGQSLTKGRECYDGIVNGLSDIGQSVLQYTRGRFPLADFINLPLGYPDGAVATALINEVYEKFQPQELMDTEVMLLHAHGPGFIHTKGRAVRKMEDLKGLKIRSHGPTAEMLKHLGATPVAFPMPELYQALQKGVVHGGVYPLEADRGWKLAEVADHVIAAHPIAYSLGFFIAMNKKKWNGLPPDIQKTIRQINREYIVLYGAGWNAQDDAGRDFFLKQGGKIIEIDAAEAERWVKAVQPVVDIYIEETRSRNLPGDAVIQYTTNRLKQVSDGTFRSPYMGTD